MNFILEEKDLILEGNLICYFYANWMPYHKKMVQILNKMEEKHNNVKFYAIDSDYFKSMNKRFNVDSLPTIIIFKDGKEVNRIKGVPMTSAVRAILNNAFF